MIAAAPVVPVLRGDARFQPALVSDVAQAVGQAVGDPARHGGKTYSLGGPDILTMTELFRWIGGAIGRDVPFVQVPNAIGAMIPFLPFAPLTRDQWAMLGTDNVVPESDAGFAAFGIAPTPLPAAAPAWLVRFRKAGRFGPVNIPA